MFLLCRSNFYNDENSNNQTQVPILGSTSPRAMVEGVLRLSVNWNALDKNKDTAREKLEQAFELLALETFLEEEKEEEKKIPYVCVLNALSDYYVTAKEGKQRMSHTRIE